MKQLQKGNQSKKLFRLLNDTVAKGKSEQKVISLFLILESTGVILIFFPSSILFLIKETYSVNPFISCFDDSLNFICIVWFHSFLYMVNKKL